MHHRFFFLVALFYPLITYFLIAREALKFLLFACFQLVIKFEEILRSDGLVSSSTTVTLRAIDSIDPLPLEGRFVIKRVKMKMIKIQVHNVSHSKV